MSILAALIATVIFIALALFQVALVAGAPFGHYAWGGRSIRLPRHLKLASLLSVIVYGISSAFILSRAGVIEMVGNQRILQYGMWLFTIYFFVGIIMNAISRSKQERNLMTPVAAVLALLFLVVTVS